MLKTSITGKTKVWVNEYEGRKLYSVSLTKKKWENGKTLDEWDYGSFKTQFKGKPEFENGEMINITSAYLSFYKKDKETIPVIIVMEFERLDAPEDNFVAINEDVPF